MSDSPLDLAWALVTVQLMFISFWRSSEDILRRLRSASPPLPLHQQQLPLDEEQQPVVLKKRRRLLQPKSVWDSEQVQCKLPLPLPVPTHAPGLHCIRARRREAHVGERSAQPHRQ